MVDEQHAPEDGARLDELRRRLYRPGATESDVQRYVADRDAGAAEPPTAAPQHPAARRLPRRGVVAGTALVLAIAAATTALTFLPTTEQRRPAASAAPRAVLQDVGDGEVLAVLDGAVSRPTAVAAFVHGAAVVGQRFSGRGNAVVAIDPPPGGAQGGRAMIAVSADGPSRIRWRALLLVHGDDRTGYPLVMAYGRAGGTGSVTPTTFLYPSRPPAQVAVQAPAGARWTLEVAVAGGLDPALR